MTNHSRGPDRVSYTVVGGVLGQSYGVEERIVVEQVGHGLIVSSRTSGGLHAPALDIDVPVALTHGNNGSILWVDGLGRAGWRRTMRAFAAAGLGGTRFPPLRGPSPAIRNTAYADMRPFTVDETDRMRVLRAAGPTFTGSFADAVQLATLTVAPAGTTQPATAYTRGPDLSDPWPVPLSEPAMLLPSTSHHHLYIDAERTWPTYRLLLEALGRAGLLEPGYVAASLDRHETHLRLPWVRKPADQHEETAAEPATGIAAFAF